MDARACRANSTRCSRRRSSRSSRPPSARSSASGSSARGSRRATAARAARVLVPLCVVAAGQGAHLLGFAGHEGIHVMLHPNNGRARSSARSSSAADVVPGARLRRRTLEPPSLHEPGVRSRRRALSAVPHVLAPLLLRARRGLARAHAEPPPDGARPPAAARLSPAVHARGAAHARPHQRRAPRVLVRALHGRRVPRAVDGALRDRLPLLGRDPAVRASAATSSTLARGSACSATRASFTHPLYTLLFFGNNYHLEHHIYRVCPATTCRRCTACSRPAATSPAGDANVDATDRGPAPRDDERRRSIPRPTNPTSRTTRSRRRSPTTPAGLRALDR
jgi:hypothetical protein